MQRVIFALASLSSVLLSPVASSALQFTLTFNGTTLVDALSTNTHPRINLGNGVKVIYLACSGATAPADGTAKCIANYRPAGLTSPTIKIEDRGTTRPNRARIEASFLNNVISVAVKATKFTAVSGVLSTGSGLQLDYSTNVCGSASSNDLPCFTAGSTHMYAGVFAGSLKTSLNLKASNDTARLTICVNADSVAACFDADPNTGNVVNAPVGDPLDPEAPTATAPPFLAGDTIGSFAQDETEDGIPCVGTTCPRITARLTWKPVANGNFMTLNANTSGGHAAAPEGPEGAAAMREFLRQFNTFSVSPQPSCNLKFDILEPLPGPEAPDNLPPVLPLKAQASYASSPPDQCGDVVLESTVSDDTLGDVVADNNNLGSVLFLPRPGTLKFGDLLDTKVDTSVARWEYVVGDCSGTWTQVALLSDGTEVAAQNGTQGTNFTTDCVATDSTPTTSGVNVWNRGDLRFSINGVFINNLSELNNLKNKSVKRLEWRLEPGAQDQAVRMNGIVVNTNDGLFTFQPTATAYAETSNLPDAGFFRVWRVAGGEPVVFVQPAEERTPHGQYIANFQTSQFPIDAAGTWRVQVGVNSQLYPNFVEFVLTPRGQ